MTALATELVEQDPTRALEDDAPAWMTKALADVVDVFAQAAREAHAMDVHFPFDP